MTSPSVTYTFTNSTTADGTQVNQNFTDLINAMTDGTKSFSIDALTVGGTALFNGPVTLGNATGDTITLGGYISGSLIGNTTAGIPHKGRTDGTAPAAGDIGQTIVSSLTSTAGSTTLDAVTDITSTSLALDAGTWIIHCSASVGVSGLGGTGSAATVLALRSGASTTVKTVVCALGLVAAGTVEGCGSITYPVTLSTSTTYKLSFFWTNYTGSPTCTGSIAARSNLGSFFAERIA